ncbi:MAG: PAS domain-containing sensor histidine kinase [Rhodospirillaceae bacterium]|nr:PAS domain-containing sensor histidine kinase [Rhodospirillaceae bacterium]
MTTEARKLLDLALPPMSIVDRAVNLVYTNRPFRQLLGISNDNAPESAPENAKMAAFRSHVGLAIAEINGHGGSITSRYLADPAGPDMNITCFPLNDGGRSQGLYVTLLSDVQASLKALEKARQAEERLNDFLACSADWVWETDATGVVTYLSERLTYIAGWPAQFFIGHRFSEFGQITHGDAADLSEIAEFQDRQPFRDFEFHVRRPSGEVFPQLISGVPAFDRETGSFIGYRGSGTDVSKQVGAMRRMQISERQLSAALSALRQKNRELEAAFTAARISSRSKSRFLATMSHELKTPLNAIIGFAEVMKSELFGDLGNRRYQSYASDIHASACMLRDLINDVLDFSAIEAGSKELRAARVMVEREAGVVVDGLRQRAEAGGLALSLLCPEGLPPIEADPQAVRRVIANLVDNALKFTPPGGAVTVIVEKRDDAVAVIVRDTGVGIPPGALSLVGQAFERAEDSPFRAVEGRGLGLGLALCRRLVDGHHGHLDIDSAIGQGTTVTVTLPLRRPPTKGLGHDDPPHADDDGPVLSGHLA